MWEQLDYNISLLPILLIRLLALALIDNDTWIRSHLSMMQDGNGQLLSGVMGATPVGLISVYVFIHLLYTWFRNHLGIAQDRQ